MRAAHADAGSTRTAIGRLHFTPDHLADNVHTLLASVSDIALGGSGAVNGVPARVKRRALPRTSFGGRWAS